MVGCITYRGLRFAHPRLSPVGLRLRVHVLSGRTCILYFCERLYPDSVLLDAAAPSTPRYSAGSESEYCWVNNRSTVVDGGVRSAVPT